MRAMARNTPRRVHNRSKVVSLQMLRDARFKVIHALASLGSLALILPAVSHTQIMQLLGHAGLRRIFANHSGTFVPDVDDGENDATGTRRRRRTKRSKHPFPPVPSEEGTKLMRSGTFGSMDYYRDMLKKRNKRLTTRIMNRELGTERSLSTYQDKIMAQVNYFT